MAISGLCGLTQIISEGAEGSEGNTNFAFHLSLVFSLSFLP